MPSSKSPTTRSGHAVICRTISGINDGPLTVAAHLGANFARWKQLPGRVGLGVDRRKRCGDNVPQRAVGANIVDAPRSLGALDVEYPELHQLQFLDDVARRRRARCRWAQSESSDPWDAPLFRCPPAVRQTNLYGARFVMKMAAARLSAIISKASCQVHSQPPACSRARARIPVGGTRLHHPRARCNASSPFCEGRSSTHLAASPMVLGE